MFCGQVPELNHEAHELPIPVERSPCPSRAVCTGWPKARSVLVQPAFLRACDDEVTLPCKKSDRPCVPGKVRYSVSQPCLAIGLMATRSTVRGPGLMQLRAALSARVWPGPRPSVKGRLQNWFASQDWSVAGGETRQQSVAPLACVVLTGDESGLPTERRALLR